ncbi:MAG: hypothetical protein ACWA45_03135 [Flavobacteriales bacterium]
MKNLTCKIVGHKLIDIKKENVLLKEYQCKNCKKKFTTDGYGKLVQLNSFWKNNHIIFEKHFQKKI